MAHITFYEKPGCGGNAKQKALLLSAGHTLDVKNLLAEEWTKESLLAFLAPLPVPRKPRTPAKFNPLKLLTVPA